MTETSARPPESIPFQEALVCWRALGTPLTNTPRLIAHFSPSGFEWGYSGPGAKGLALNVLEALLQLRDFEGPREELRGGESCFQLALELHESFVEEYIEPMFRAGATIPRAELDGWLDAQLEGQRKATG